MKIEVVKELRAVVDAAQDQVEIDRIVVSFERRANCSGSSLASNKTSNN
jgi:hypothetical protein